MADGRHFENGFIAISQPRINEIWCASADFGSKDGHVTKYQNFANSKWWTAAILKIVLFLTISQRYFVQLTESHAPTATGHVTKILNFENSGWRTTAILKMIISLYEPGIIRFQLNLVCRRKFWFKERSRDKNLKLRMAIHI